VFIQTKMSGRARLGEQLTARPELSFARKPVDIGRFVNKFRILADGHQHFVAFAIGSDLYKYTSEAMPVSAAASIPVHIDKP